MTMSPELFIALMFLALIIGLLMGHPVAFVLGGLAVLFGYLGGMGRMWPILIGRTYDIVTNEIYVAIPLFILMATLLERAGIAEGLFQALMHVFGGMPGSIGLAVVVLSVIFAATTGIMGATVVSMSLMAMPAMLNRGYDKRLATGAVAAGGTLGILIPPSIMLVLMADQSGISVGRLFAGALGPGLLLGLLYFGYVAILTHIKPKFGPPLSAEERDSVSGGQLVRMLLVNLIPPLVLIFGVLGSIWLGVATPTEASAVGAALAFVLMVAYRQFSWRALADAIWRATRTSAMVIGVIIGASLFTAVFLRAGGGAVVTNLVTSFDFLGRWGVFVAMMAIVLLLGFLVDWIGIILITFPIFLPISASLGFDPVWFVIMMAINLQASFLTPPVGYALFYLKGTVPPGVRLADIYRGVFPFVALQVLGVIVVAMFPAIAAWLPSLIARG
ncbi:TRAP transporter large permease [Limnochorda pilosa]|uniref:C4-dicarboxylate ABC transporter n=1 Tax=Limnochorda pilosa TaxID=1555112 RepID=A0A0K2SPG0_LIMPI|nr:TRAP transporter large permease subunit [Limnochorda pilosa]BAS28694.1 C4-dicarboxylate ABC transporter [Limnochorda pilosa]